jgi:hypothetical protein
MPNLPVAAILTASQELVVEALSNNELDLQLGQDW